MNYKFLLLFVYLSSVPSLSAGMASPSLRDAVDLTAQRLSITTATSEANVQKNINNLFLEGVEKFSISPSDFYTFKFNLLEQMLRNLNEEYDNKIQAMESMLKKANEQKEGLEDLRLSINRTLMRLRAVNKTLQELRLLPNREE